MSKKVAVVLSGCGFLDGAEIHEAVFSLLALDRLGVTTICTAPNVAQFHVINHVTGEPTTESRNVFVESARIARGEIRDLAKLSVSEVDGAVFPGGYGAAKNLSRWAIEAESGAVQPEVERFVRELREAKKPMGFMCIAPVIAAKVLANGTRLTLGNEAQVASSIEKLGAVHEISTVNNVIIDEERKVISTPAFMLGKRFSEVADGIDKLCRAVVSLAG